MLNIKYTGNSELYGLSYSFSYKQCSVLGFGTYGLTFESDNFCTDCKYSVNAAAVHYQSERYSSTY